MRRATQITALLLVACSRRDAPPAPPSPGPATSSSAEPAGFRDASLAPAPVSAAPTPFAADVEARVREAHTRFGEAARVRVVGDTFAFVETGAPSPLFTYAAALVERALPPLFDGRLTRHPDRGVTVLFFPSTGPWLRYIQARFPDAGGRGVEYQPGSREIVVDASNGSAALPSLLHDVVQPLVESDFPGAPLWVQEGLASTFEDPLFPDGGLPRDARHWRRGDLASALRLQARAELRLDVLFGMSDESFRHGAAGTRADLRDVIEALHYALARSVCVWLDGQGKLWPFYHAWRDGYASDKGGENAFAAVMGMTPKQANAKWVSWAM